MRRRHAVLTIGALLATAACTSVTPPSGAIPTIPTTVPTSTAVPSTTSAAPTTTRIASSTTSTASSTTTAPPSRVIERVVTLGDSYSSGQGIHDDADQYDDHGPPAHSFDPDTRLGGSTCHRETDTTPGPLLAEQLGAASIFVACSGAVIAEIDNQLAVARIPGDGAGTLVTMTIGGNDLRTGEGYDWPTALLECITSFGCNDDEVGGLDNLDAVEDGLRALYTGMGVRYPSAHVRVLAYPSLMQADRLGCVGVVGVGRAEADWIDGQEALFVERIERAVTAAAATTGADLRFVGVDDAFDNHGACRTFGRDRYVRSIVRGTTLSRSMDPNGEVVEHRDDGVFTISPASFHPSQRGYDAFYEVLVESLPAGVTIRSD